MNYDITATVKRNLMITFVLCIAVLSATAQKDTSSRQTIDIISSYKPVLRNAIKINLAATNLNADTSKPKLKYSIPEQNLFYTYSPAALKPLALDQDTSLDLGTRNFIKLGIGNYTTPYARAGLGWGDGKKYLLNFYGDYIQSTGNLQNEDYSQLNLKLAGSYFTPKNEFYGNANLSAYDYYLYGYNDSLYHYTKQDVFRSYQTFSIKAAMRNTVKNDLGIDYDPSIQAKIFTSQEGLTETSLLINAPATKKFGDNFSFKIAAIADITSTSINVPTTNTTNSNNIFQLAPEIIVKGDQYIVHGGITPSWYNNTLSVLPNIYGETKIQGQPFLLQFGWVGQFIKNTAGNLSVINPYMQLTTTQPDTKEVELYGGIKASVANHFNISAKVSFITYHNLPLFINDSLDGKTFDINNESKANDFRFHVDMSYINQDKFTITGGVTFNGYTGLQNNKRAWGELPIEANASLRWKAFKDVTLKSDLYAFGGAPYLLANNVQGTLGGGADLSAGIEVGITKKVSAWLDINNLLNDKYQRWYNYPVYGINFLGGIIVKF